MDAKSIEIEKKTAEITTNLLEPLIEDVSGTEVEVTVTRSVIVINVTPAKADVGKIIGKQGKNIEAVRTLLNAYANRFNYRCHVEVIE